MTKLKQEKVTKYYDHFARFYDLISSDAYYRKPRLYAIKEMDIKAEQYILNIPCGTGQNFGYFQDYLKRSGKVLGLDLSLGMLEKAQMKVKQNGWENIHLIQADATELSPDWIREKTGEELKFDAILCDLGLSGFPEWKTVIDHLLELLKPHGKIVIMDWYIPKPSLRGFFIKWIGKGEVNRPIFQYLEEKVENFKLNDSFKGGQMFVASGIKLQ